MPPSVTETITWNPDPAADQFVEDWSGDLSKWRSDWAPSPFGLVITPNDGLMGGPFARSEVGWGFQGTAKAFFDHTRGFVWRWRQRVPTPNWDGAPWQGQGVVLSGEMSYGGGAAEGYGQFSQGSYPGGIGNVVDIEQEYLPTTKQVRGRWKIGAGAWSAWETRALDLSVSFWPVQWWSGGVTDNGIDLGYVRLAGTRLWGAQDGYGFENWTLTNAGIWEAQDSSKIIGGLCGGVSPVNDPWGAPISLGLDASTPVRAPGAAFGATSPTVGVPSGSRYAEFRFDLGGYTEGTAHVRLRNAADDSLISDTYLPGNAAGLETVATALPGSGGNARIRRVSLAGIPQGVQVYVDFQAQNGSTAPQYQQPRLGGAWVSFGQIIDSPASDTATARDVASDYIGVTVSAAIAHYAGATATAVAIYAEATGDAGRAGDAASAVALGFERPADRALAPDATVASMQAQERAAEAARTGDALTDRRVVAEVAQDRAAAGDQALVSVLIPGVLQPADAEVVTGTVVGQDVTLAAGQQVGWQVSTQGGAFDLGALLSSVAGGSVEVVVDGQVIGTWSVPPG